MQEKKYDLLCIGCMVCDFLLRPVPKDFYTYDTFIMDSMENNMGGDAANQSVIAAKLGGRVALVTETGADGTGRELIDYLGQFGIDTSHITSVPGKRTQTSVLAICEDGERHALILPLSQTGYGSPELDYSLLEQTRAVSIGSMRMYPKLDAQLPAYFKRARELGVITAGDVMQTGKPLDLQEVFPYLDYFFPNELEGEELTGEKEPEKIAGKLLSYGVKNVILKLGGKGSYIRNEKESFYVPARKVTCVDTTGAGDNFVAGFLTAVMKGWDLRTCAEFATAVSSVCVQHMGTTTGVQSMEQILDVLGWKTT